MSDSQSPSLHGWTPGFGQDTFPGLGDSFAAGPPEVINPVVLPAQVTTATKGGLPFNISNLSDLKAMVDRMGGIEGVLTTMGKFQKFMSTVQQVAPLIKLFMGNKGSKLVTANTNKSGATRRRRSTTRPRAGKASARTKRPVKRR